MVTMYHFLNMFVMEINDQVHNQDYIQYEFVDQDNKLVVLVYIDHLLLDNQLYKLHLQEEKKISFFIFIYLFIYLFVYNKHQ
jgi:hypothetical protein